MRGHPLARWVLLAAPVVASLLATACAPPATPIPAKEGHSIQARLDFKSPARYSIDLDRGDFVEIAVTQENADLVIWVDPRGEERYKVDTVLAENRPERLLHVAERRETLRFRVDFEQFFKEGTPVPFEIQVVAYHKATDLERRRARAHEALARAEAVRRLNGQPSPRVVDDALDRYSQAERDFARVGDPLSQAYTLVQHGILWEKAREPEKAWVLYRRALAIAPEQEWPSVRARAATQATILAIKRGASEEAEAAGLVAREIWRRLGERGQEAGITNQLALLAKQRGQLARAETWYREGLEVWRASGNSENVAITLVNLAAVYIQAGDGELALEAAQEADDAADDESPTQLQALEKKASALTLLGRLDEARVAIEAAAKIRFASANPVDRTRALQDLAHAAYDRGEYVEAERGFLEALEASAKIETAERPRLALTCRLGLAWSLLKLGKLDAATEVFEQARVGARPSAQTEPWNELSAAAGLARVELRRGHLERAEAVAQETIETAERLRQAAGRGELATSTFAELQALYDVAVSIAVARFEKTRDSSILSRGFALSERARARQLADSLARGPVPPGTPRPAAEGQPLDFATVQAALDGRTALWLFDLGEDESFLWLATRESLTVVRLGSREDLERTAQAAIDVLASPLRVDQSRRGQAALAEASRVLLEPALRGAPFEGAMGNGDIERWLVIGEGPLAALPWSALPDPREVRRRVLDSYEVASAPSATLATHLSTRALAFSESSRLAIVTDPITSRNDSRFVPPLPPQLEPERRGLPADLPRLPASALEAQRLLARVRPEGRIALQDFEAEKDRVLAGAVGEADLVHFSVHARPDREHPEFSHLWLSLYARDGSPRDGALYAHEIAGLPWRAGLVVLSACESGQGKSVLGEGLVGLPHAFLSAGAARVVATSWPVDDRATARLMDLLYAELFRGASPSAALRSAQTSMSRDPKWSRPIFWAGFTLQGGF